MQVLGCERESQSLACVSTRNSMMSIIWLSGSNWRLPTALLAPAELRARRTLWIPDKNHKSITKMRNTTATGTVAGYSISREGITVHPGVTQMTPVHSQNNSSVTQMAPVHSQNNSSVRSLGSGARGVARVILRLLERFFYRRARSWRACLRARCGWSCRHDAPSTAHEQQRPSQCSATQPGVAHICQRSRSAARLWPRPRAPLGQTRGGRRMRVSGGHLDGR